MVKEIKQKTSETVEFAKRLSGITVALSLLGLGIYAITLAHNHRHVVAISFALSISGAINVIAGAITLYKVLMRKEA